MKALGLPFSEGKNFDFCPLCSYVQNCDPRGGANLDPRGIILTNLVEIHKEMLYTQYESSRPSIFKEAEF